ncbi:hypothetical protein EC991_001243 [Linnemannia zychae]|nr:hypothetical protein EC991_001243 [Linnemannia zychae]
MKFIAFALSALALLRLSHAQSPFFTNCAMFTPTQLAIQYFSVTPYPLCINKDVTFSIMGTLSAPLDQGSYLTMEGRYLGRLVYTDTQSLCTLLIWSGRPCPVPITANFFDLSLLVKPNAPPNVAVELTVTARNAAQNLIFCQKATVTAVFCPP